MSEIEWVLLMEVGDRLKAEILKSALVADGIPAEFFQEAVGQLYTISFGPIGTIQICVPSDRLEEAHRWMQAYNTGELWSNNEEYSDPDHE